MPERVASAHSDDLPQERTLISMKLIRVSNPWNGPPPPVSFPASFAQILQLMGFRSSAPQTNPKQINNTETIVSIDISGGRLIVLGVFSAFIELDVADECLIVNSIECSQAE